MKGSALEIQIGRDMTALPPVLSPSSILLSHCLIPLSFPQGKIRRASKQFFFFSFLKIAYVGTFLYSGQLQFCIDRLRLRILGGRSSPLRTGLLYPQEFSWYSFLEAESTPGHMVPSVASEKIPSDNTGDRSRDLPTSSAVP